MSVRFTAGVQTSIYDLVKAIAQNERRSINNTLNLLLEEALAARGLMASSIHKTPTQDTAVDLQTALDMLEG